MSAKLHNGDDSKLKNALAISKRLSSEMESLLGEIQRQLSVNAITLTNNGKRFNYGQTVMAILYIMTYLMGVSMESNMCFILPNILNISFAHLHARWSNRFVTWFG